MDEAKLIAQTDELHHALRDALIDEMRNADKEYISPAMFNNWLAGALEGADSRYRIGIQASPDLALREHAAFLMAITAIMREYLREEHGIEFSTTEEPEGN